MITPSDKRKYITLQFRTWNNYLNKTYNKMYNSSKFFSLGQVVRSRDIRGSHGTIAKGTGANKVYQKNFGTPNFLVTPTNYFHKNNLPEGNTKFRHSQQYGKIMVTPQTPANAIDS